MFLLMDFFFGKNKINNTCVFLVLLNKIVKIVTICLKRIGSTTLLDLASRRVASLVYDILVLLA